MISALFGRRSGPTDPAAALYGAIVAQSRRPEFYANAAVPDTVDGRFDMIVLHLVLVSRRLPRDLAQAVFDAFCRDMDANLREMGVGDLKVPEEMRRCGEAFYGRAAAYEPALAAANAEGLAAALARNVYGEAGLPTPEARWLAAYAQAVVARLETTDLPLREGRIDFPDLALQPSPDLS